jgi:hypothetical protein
MFRHALPLEIQRHILSFDSTYRSHFSKEVLPELMEEAWKKITYKFFTRTMDWMFIDDEMFGLLSDFEDDDEVDEETTYFQAQGLVL